MNDYKHLDLLQEAIARMASNSFAAKGWSIGLTTALIAYSLRGNNLRLVWVAVIPVALFWSLDAYYLALERGFRELFKAAVETAQKGGPITFDMQPGEVSLKIWIRTMVRPAVLLVHSPLLGVLVAMMIVGFRMR